ncbi:MAG: phosphotransferase [Gallionella sp.]|nr:phosphotransferase [Gallionella sp.]
MHTQPFSALTPDAVLDALDSIGLRSDGRLLALNSYENRVYQAGMEDGPPLVVKFYRPARWPDAAILEEHAFVATLVEREIPVVPALAIAARRFPKRMPAAECRFISSVYGSLFARLPPARIPVSRGCVPRSASSLLAAATSRCWSRYRV